jgi:hypothetical protein
MRLVLVVLLLATSSVDADRERPPKSAIAVVDNWLDDLENKRFSVAEKALAPTLRLRSPDCKKPPDAPTVKRSLTLVRCLASKIQWPKDRLVGQESATKQGWRVTFEGFDFDVKRSGTGFEIESIRVPGMSSR